MKQIIEKKLEFNEDLYVCIMDFAQGYDSVWRKECGK